MSEDRRLPETEDASAAEPTVGELLIAARERQQLSAADIARQLRLALRQVEAMEANRFDALPGNTFVRGFLRNYAKAVQVEPIVFLEAYERHRPAWEHPEIMAPAEHIEFTRKAVPKWIWYFAGLVVLVVALPLILYGLLQGDELPFRPLAKKTLHGISPASAPHVPTTLALPPPEVVPQAAGAMPALPADAPPATAGSLAGAPAVSTGSAPAPGQQTATIRFTFQGDSWVEVRDQSEKPIFAQLNVAGSEQVVEGKPPFSLVIGNAAKVRIAYNGKPVDLAPHVKVNVARFTLE